jgi:hypothetical protein
MRQKRYLIFFALALPLSCQTPELKPDPEIDLSRLVMITSPDPVLVELICRRVLCGPGPVLDIQLHIRETSHDYFRNNGLSLLTLTTGLFVSHSATVDYTLTLDFPPNEVKEGTIHIRDGYWFVLPFYAGLIGTNLGTLLNGYRDPKHLQTYCLDRVPGRWREFFDGDRSEICREYRRFLSVTLESLWPELQVMLTGLPSDPNLKHLRAGGL